MVMYKKLVLVLAAVFAGSLSMAQVQELTLKDALNYALSNYRDARKAKLDVENAEYQIQETRARALPQLSGTGNLTYNPLLQKSAIPGEFIGQPGQTLYLAFGLKWSAMVGANVSQTLFDQGVFTGLKATNATRQFYRINQQLTEEQVIEQVANNYYQVLVQRQKIVVIDSNLQNTRRVQGIIRGQYENGLAKKIDLDRITVTIANLSTQKTQLQNAVQLQENTLKFYMGMPIETPVYIPAAQLNNIRPQMAAGSSNDSVKLDTRTEYQLLRKQQELLTFDRDAKKAAYYPTLTFNGNYNYQGLGNTFPIGKNGGSSGVNWFGYSSLGLNMRIPIFTGFATRARVSQAKIELRRNEEDMRYTGLALNLAYQNAKTQINNSIITIELQQRNVTLAQEVFDNTQNNYNQGLAPLTDLLNAEQALNEAQNNYNTALLDYKLAEIQLVKSQGQLRNLLN
jgi:outer membrane protein